MVVWGLFVPYLFVTGLVCSLGALVAAPRALARVPVEPRTGTRRAAEAGRVLGILGTALNGLGLAVAMIVAAA